MTKRILWLALLAFLGICLLLFPRKAPPSSTFQTSPNSSPKAVEITKKQDRHGIPTARYLLGNIVDHEGQALGNVAMDVRALGVEAIDQASYVSEQDGSFRIPWPFQDAKFLIFSRNGYQESRLLVQDHEASFLAVLFPLPAENQSQVLHIVDEAGEPIPSVWVIRNPGVKRETANGEIQLEHFSTVEKLQISARGFVTKTFTEFHDFDNPQAIPLTRIFSFKASVSDRDTGKPLKNCTFYFEQPGEFPVIKGVAKNNLFSISNLHPQARLKEIRAKNYLTYYLDPFQSEFLQYKPEDIHQFVLQKASYRLKVLDSQGKSKAGAKVHFLTIQRDTLKQMEIKTYLKEGRRYIHTQPSPFQSFQGKQNHYSDPWYFSHSIWAARHMLLTNAAGLIDYSFPEDVQAVDLFVEAEGYQPKFISRADLLQQKVEGPILVRLEKYASLTIEAGQAHLPYKRRIKIVDGARQEHELTLQPGESLCHFSDVESGKVYVYLEGVEKIDTEPRQGIPYSDFETYGVISDRQIAHVKPGEHQRVQVGFKNAYKLAGRLLWDGKPLPGQALEIYTPYLSDQEERLLKTTTDPLGHFTVEALPQGIYGIRIESHRHETTRNLNNKVIVELQKDLTDVLLDFRSSGSVLGQILNPPSGYFVELLIRQNLPWNELEELTHQKYYVDWDRGPNPNPNVMIFVPDESHKLRGEMRIPLDSSGHFRFEKVPPGTLSLFLGKGDQYVQTLRQDVPMPDSGEDLDLGRIRLAQTGRISIAFQGGEPFAGKKVEIAFRGQSVDSYFPEIENIITFPIGAPITQEIPQGPVNIWTFIEGDEWRGFEIQDPFATHIEPFKTTYLTIPLIPMTFLSMEIMNLPPEGHLQLEIRNISTGFVIQLDESYDDHEFHENASFHYFMDEHQGILQASLLGRRVPEGLYQIGITKGPYHSMNSVYLQRGKPLELTLNSSDFNLVQKTPAE